MTRAFTLIAYKNLQKLEFLHTYIFSKQKTYFTIRPFKFNDSIKLLNYYYLSNFNDLLPISKESNVGDKKNQFHTNNLQFE